MEPIEIKFNEIKTINSQRTVELLLKKHKYYFKPINEYSNTLFYCIIRIEKYDAFENFYNIFRLQKLKPKKIEYIEHPLCLTIQDIVEQESEPIVFDRYEINLIIKDIPENYIGENIL